MSSADLAARWQELWTSVGAGGTSDLGEKIIDAYSQSHRAYHGLEHLRDCLDELDSATQLAQRPEEVELALWFHDVVYKPLSSKNEEASASWAAKVLGHAGIDRAAIDRVVMMILATQHNSVLEEPDPCLTADIDLAVFGRDRAGFAAYEEGIRQEFCWVPGPTFRKRRAERLGAFLARANIYYTEEFRDRYEEQAKKNLSAAIRKLSG